jgi:hypothetical protein
MKMTVAAGLALAAIGSANAITVKSGDGNIGFAEAGATITYLPTSTVYNSFNALPILDSPGFNYAAPVAGSNWVSPVLAADNTPSRTAVSGLTGNFLYSKTFSVATADIYDISGLFLSDDDVVSIAIDGTVFSTPAALGNPGSYQIQSAIVGVSSFLAAGNHTFDFIVKNDGQNATALSFSAELVGRNAPPVPEPGAVAFSVIMGGSLLGLMGRARRAVKK